MELRKEQREEQREEIYNNLKTDRAKVMLREWIESNDVGLLENYELAYYCAAVSVWDAFWYSDDNPWDQNAADRAKKLTDTRKSSRIFYPFLKEYD